jgi:hypothetical protein
MSEKDLSHTSFPAWEQMGSWNVPAQIGGQVTLGTGGPGLKGVAISVTGTPQPPTPYTTTDSNGDYTLQVPGGGSYTVTPSLPNFSFTPPSTAIANAAGTETVNAVAAYTGTTPWIAGVSVNGSPALRGHVGDSVTISGFKFGSTQGTSTVAFGGVNNTAVTASVLGWADNSVTVAVPPTAVIGNVIVTVNGAQALPFWFWVQPVIISLSLNQGPPQMGLVVNGSGFGGGGGQVVFAGSWPAQPITFPAIQVADPKGLGVDGYSALAVEVQMPPGTAPPLAGQLSYIPVDSGGNPVPAAVSNSVPFQVNVCIGCSW